MIANTVASAASPLDSDAHAHIHSIELPTDDIVTTSLLIRYHKGAADRQGARAFETHDTLDLHLRIPEALCTVKTRDGTPAMPGSAVLALFDHFSTYAISEVSCIAVVITSAMRAECKVMILARAYASAQPIRRRLSCLF